MAGTRKAAGLRKGTKVSWNSPQGKVEGTVVRKLTSRTKIKGHDVAATKEKPEFLVESDQTGAHAAHKQSSLRRRK